jgi:hypothetical protein
MTDTEALSRSEDALLSRSVGLRGALPSRANPSLGHSICVEWVRGRVEGGPPAIVSHLQRQCIGVNEHRFFVVKQKRKELI